MAAGSGLVGRFLSALRREPRDAFSDDGESFEDFDENAGEVEDDEDDDEESPSLGRTIALIASAVIFVLLSGLGLTVYLVGRNATPSMVMAPLGEMKVEEDIDAPAMSAQTTPAKAPDVAATDHSTDRRPWLNNPSQPKPADQAPAAAAVTPPTPPPAPVAAAPPPAAPPPMASAPPPAEPAPPAPAAAASEPPPVPVDVAPGAPDRFNVAGDSNAGGRPRLVEPPLPPVDRKALSAPPPRFASIADMKAKVVAYKVAVADKSGDKQGRTSKIAIVVRDLGLSQAATEAAIAKLPPAITFSFSPYAQDLKKWIDMAKANGHEVLIELPMESKQFPAEDPGPLGLMIALEPKKNLEHFDAVMKSAAGALGIDDDMGSKFRESDAAMSMVFAKLKEKNLVYVQTEPGARIGEPGIPNAAADVIIDERPFRAAIDARLDYVERLAKFQGSALAVMGPKPVSFERVALWLNTLNDKGIILTPVSEVLLRQEQETDKSAQPKAQKPAGGEASPQQKASTQQKTPSQQQKKTQKRQTEDG